MTSLSPIASAAIGSLLSSLASPGAGSSAGASFYEDLRDGFAKEVIAEYATGAVALLKPPSAQEEDADPLNPHDGWPLRTPRLAVVLGFETDQIDGKQILVGDRKVIMDAADFTTANRPAGSDFLEIDNVKHTIESVQQIPAAGVAVLYIFQARTAGG